MNTIMKKSVIVNCNTLTNPQVKAATYMNPLEYAYMLRSWTAT